MSAELSRFPSVDKVLSEGRVRELCKAFPRELVVNLIRRKLADARQEAMRGGPIPSVEEVASWVEAKANELGSLTLRRVINATGVILHTNLGRAPLSREAIKAMEEASLGYCNLEFDLETGKRGSRQVHVEELLCQLTGAEAALVVNNNASGVLLALTALAKRKEERFKNADRMIMALENLNL